MEIKRIDIDLDERMAITDPHGYFGSYVKGKRQYIKLTKEYLEYVNDIKRAFSTTANALDNLSYAFNNINVFKEKEKTIKLMSIWFNEKKGVTVVKWSDDTITKVTLQNNDKWDKEKGVALCYMKKFSGNNSSFNEVLKEQVYNSED